MREDDDTELTLTDFADFDVDPRPVVIVRGIDPPIFDRPSVQRMPTAKRLMTLAPYDRAFAIFVSGVRPRSAAMRRAFESVLEFDAWPHAFGTGEALRTGMPQNGSLYRGENRLNEVIWPNGAPPLPVRAKRRPIVRPLSSREEPSLWKRLPCGCLDRCIGKRIHAAEVRKRQEEEAALEAQRLDLVERLVRQSLAG